MCLSAATGQSWWPLPPPPSSSAPNASLCMPLPLRPQVLNAHVPERSYWSVVVASAAITQQLCTVVAAVAVPVHLRAGNISAQQLLVVCSLLLVLGYATCAVLGNHLLGGSLARGARQGVLLVGGVYLLSPLIKTLAATVSADSIVALTSVLLLAHLFLHDYSFVNSMTDCLTGTLALGAAILAAVLISSLMVSELHVFAQVLLSLELYLLSPYVRRYIHAASTTAHLAVTVALVGIAVGLLQPLSPGLAASLVAAVLAISFLFPWQLVSITKYKAKINGPWDEAVPVIPKELQVSMLPKEMR
ncbi:phosphatidylinositol N-acetylglucosaminyltransferase subunit C [Dunaliella salina]|uniref:Phosphatidylinositol N-acetylglucosaminyltransferase subunit C n=1 Tax=Dunaliella salina TaxID=3046 RepID=A0ABQ7HAH8_DUNSA|nr:phosphatidylinositol N-acetylglucosaminyltransferase subunit C [Dunaliella salina]|eukprot:KAF5843860.1 phosphatidylinositol N-acetylglucosaminyltransferase subunit C [Dunaliella salina]